MVGIAQRAVARVGRIGLSLVLEVDRPDHYERLGSDYGGWWIPEKVLKPGNVAYCAGVGEDLSFDAELVKRGLRVVAFDPTPRSVEYARTADLGPGFEFEDVGWWDTTGSERFYAPADPTHVSHSVVNLQGTDEYFIGKVETVRSVMDRRGDDIPQLIKMDIEGAEFRVLRSMVGSGVLPMVLCVEFDQPAPLGAVLTAVRNLRRVGYQVESVEQWNLTFVKG